MKLAIFVLLAALLAGAVALQKLDYLDVDSNGLHLRVAAHSSRGVFNACEKLGGRVEGPFLEKGKPADDPNYLCRASIPWLLIGTIVVGLAVVGGFALTVSR